MDPRPRVDPPSICSDLAERRPTDMIDQRMVSLYTRGRKRDYLLQAIPDLSGHDLHDLGPTSELFVEPLDNVGCP